MQIIVSEFVTRTVVIAPQERIDAFNAPQLRERLLELLNQGVSRIVLDLSSVPFLDSAGMAVLVTTLKRARQAGGDAKLVWPREEAARRILHLTRFDKVFDLAETVDEAVTLF